METEHTQSPTASHAADPAASERASQTPGPWEVRRQTLIAPTRIHQENSFLAVCTVQVFNVPEWEANAAFIVRACNNYERLRRTAQAFNVRIDDDLLFKLDVGASALAELVAAIEADADSDTTPAEETHRRLAEDR